MIIDDNGIRYQCVHGKATAIGITKTFKGTCLRIPEIVAGYTVIAIGKAAFERTARFTTVYLPKTICRIENGAFYTCTGLKEVHMERDRDNVQHCQIEKYAFAFCGDLKELDLPVFLFMHQQACINCRSLRYITGLIVNLGTNTFSGCKQLEKIFFANDAELMTDAMCLAEVSQAVFIGDAQIAADVIKTFYDSNTTIYCGRESNIADIAYYGLKVEFI